MAYGLEIENRDDTSIAAAERAVQIVASCVTPGSFLVDLIPIRAFYIHCLALS